MVLLWVVFFNLLDISSASRGDRLPEYRACVETLFSHHCDGGQEEESFLLDQPVFDRLTGWSCFDQVKYRCQWNVTNLIQSRSKGVVMQFHGKWPFLKYFGCQEVCSTLFSLLNGYLNVNGLAYLFTTKEVQQKHRKLWSLFAGVQVVGWLCSAIFHARDTPFTEGLDYTGAMLMNSGFCLALIIRVTQPSRLSNVMILAVVSFVLHHIYGLLFVQLDYSYNMKIHIALGAVTVIGWLCWCIVTVFLSTSTDHASGRSRKAAFYCASTLILNSLSVLLELGDFPPVLWLLDAHALWHLSTAPLIVMWWKFIRLDCLNLASHGERLSTVKKLP